MMVVVLGNEETQVDNGHRLLEARVKRLHGELISRKGLEPPNEVRATLGKLPNDVRDDSLVVIRDPGGPVLQICWTQSQLSPQQVLDPTEPQRFEIGQVPGVFCNGPRLVVPTSRLSLRQSRQTLLETSGCPAQALDDLGLCTKRHPQLERTIEPDSPLQDTLQRRPPGPPIDL